MVNTTIVISLSFNDRSRTVGKNPHFLATLAITTVLEPSLNVDFNRR